jgi:DNA-binding beta-propeller fold protein YncE
MSLRRHFLLVSLAVFLAVWSVPALAQVVTTTLPVGNSPVFAATNTVTNTAYVANQLCSTPPCTVPGTVTVIDGATNSIKATVNVGINPGPIVANSVTNRIYVANTCGGDSTCQSRGTITIIDGATLATTNLTVGYVPSDIAINSLTNKIYVANECLGPGYPNSCPTCATGMTGTLTVIDGSTLATQNVPITCSPNGVAVNENTNTIYASSVGNLNDPSNGSVTVINGTTLSTQTLSTEMFTGKVRLNPGTNQIYAPNACSDQTCQNGGSVTVINGATLQTQNVAVGITPLFLAVDTASNNVYTANFCRDQTCTSGPAITLLNGTTLSATTFPVCHAGNSPADIEVNSVTNKIYFPCYGNGGTVLGIDGVTNAIIPIAVGDEPTATAINSATNTIYVPNAADNTVSVIGGATTLQLMAVPPCRLLDTRQGGGPIQGGTYQTFNLPQLASANGCANLSAAVASSLNVTLVPQNGRPVGYLTIWPTSQIQPVVSTMNSLDGRIKANAAIVPAGVAGAVNIYVADTADVVLDLDGYFTPPTSQTLQFHPLQPCRVADTRKSDFPQGLGTPHLSASTPRDFPVLESTCIPQNVNAVGYSFNITAIPYPDLGDPLSYLEVWPTGGEPAHPVSTLNNPTGTYVANAAIVEAGTGGEITAFASNDTDLAIDIDGYFSAPGSGAPGLSLYPTPPCRVIDTRKIGTGQPFTGVLNPPVDVAASPCGTASTSFAYVLNATVVPSPSLSYLTLWPDLHNQPVVSTLNAVDGWITSNMAIVPTSNGQIDAYAAGVTQLVLDISAYFAP